MQRYASYLPPDTERLARMAYLGYAEAAGVIGRVKEWKELTEHTRACWRAAANEVADLVRLEHSFATLEHNL